MRTSAAPFGPTVGNTALVFAADDGFAEGLAVALHSALTRLARTIRPDVYILDNGLSASTRSRIHDVVERTDLGDRLHWLEVPPDERLRPFAIDSRLTPSTYSRLLIPELLPAQIERAVYLDADLLIREDVSPLFDVDLRGSPIGAVGDFAIPTTDNPASGVRDRATPRPYFNAGVLVMDIARWRETGLADQALAYAAEGEEQLRNREQDALNAVAPDWFELDYRWNVQHTYFPLTGPPSPSGLSGPLRQQRRQLYRRAAILHFIGEPKPWYRYCSTPGTTAWVRDLLHTGWYSRGEGLRWVMRHGANRARYWAGTRKRALTRNDRRA